MQLRRTDRRNQNRHEIRTACALVNAEMVGVEERVGAATDARGDRCGGSDSHELSRLGLDDLHTVVTEQLDELAGRAAAIDRAPAVAHGELGVVTHRFDGGEICGRRIAHSPAVGETHGSLDRRDVALAVECEVVAPVVLVGVRPDHGVTVDRDARTVETPTAVRELDDREVPVQLVWMQPGPRQVLAENRVPLGVVFALTRAGGWRSLVTDEEVHEPLQVLASSDIQPAS